jgi:hypothetical protein
MEKNNIASEKINIEASPSNRENESILYIYL